MCREESGPTWPRETGIAVADRLIVRGAREHNLKDVSLDLPRDALIVFTGLSGSGKSSLAFDTIFAEQQPARLGVRNGPGPSGRRPLLVLLQSRRGLGALQLLRGCHLLQRPQPPVLSDGNHHGGFPAQMDHLMQARLAARSC